MAAEVTSQHPRGSLSIHSGIPLSEEPGLGPLTIPAYAREITSRHAASEAMVIHAPHGVERWTYAKLWDQSLQVAKALIAAGVNKDTRVGILMANRPEYFAVAFGTALAGGVIVPLSTFSTPPELEYLLQTAAVSVLFLDTRVLKKDFVAMLSELESEVQKVTPGRLCSAKFPFLRHLVVLRSVTDAAVSDGAGGAIEPWHPFLARGAATPSALVDARAASVRPADAGALFFSSGTTSLPKGILHAQRAPCIHWWRWPRLLGFNEPVRSWTGNGFFWSGNFTMVAGAAFSTGGAIVLQPTFDAEQALELMQAERVSMPMGRPHQWARLQAAPNWKTVDLSSVRYIDRRMTLAQHPTIKAGWQLPPSYGNTEMLTINTSFANTTPPDIMGKSHGEPLAGNTIKIVDPVTGAVRPRGERGEIAVKGPTLMLGYIGKTVEETFDAEGYFRTGDGGYLDEAGRLYWEGRLTEIIKTGGANVSPLEVDAVLAPFAGVKIAQTVGVPHETLGEMVVSCIVPQEGAVIDEATVRSFLKEKLASYKVPRRVLFFSENEMAVTANGKVKAGDLRELAAKRLGVTMTGAEAG